ncbi:hypothetical protein LCGC14_2009390 [marine sediment metagenome]|uniref:Uncharacterized protein n=1 Tax=marine sediment metagenome TaxID=412755 RepID=A0A0F9HXV2_9ZZZZ
MPDADNIQVAVVSRLLVAGFPWRTAFEMGSRGQAVRLFAVHYSWERLFSDSDSRLKVAMSTNPEHEISPPLTEPAWMLDKSLYASFSGGFDQDVRSDIGYTFNTWRTAVIPLYGIIRPRRQVLVGNYVSATGMNFRAEIYYSVAELGKTELDTLNLKYGKYRRRA